jgi:hypothetical protein
MTMRCHVCGETTVAPARPQWVGFTVAAERARLLHDCVGEVEA